jgi:hypothetical protein
MPPMNDKNYEKELLGSYLIGAKIGSGVTDSVFSTTANKTVFHAIKDLKARGVDVDIVILVKELKKHGELDAAGGAAYVADLTTGIISDTNTNFYESEVIEAYRKRTLLRTVLLAKEALEKGEEPEMVQNDLVKTISSLSKVVKEDRGVFFSDLMKKEFPPEDWYIDRLITSGLTVLTGASKIGKSWTALQLVTALDQGGCFLGTLAAKKCDVLYMALEDTEKRIQRRIRKQGMTEFNGSQLETKRCTSASLRAYLSANLQFRVVIIDTLQKMLGMNDLNDYSQTVDGLSALKAIADDLNITVIVIHHNRKGGNEDSDHMESALGSTGINATADCTLTMRRKRGTNEATLAVTGRDVEDTAYTLQWDKDICSWAITEQGELKPSISEVQQQIIGLLESDARLFTTAEIAKVLGIQKYEVSRQAAALAVKGLIEKPIYGQWKAKHKLETSDAAETSTPGAVPIQEPETW